MTLQAPFSAPGRNSSFGPRRVLMLGGWTGFADSRPLQTARTAYNRNP